MANPGRGWLVTMVDLYLFLMYVMCDYLSHTHKIPARPKIIIITGIDPYVGYCIQHNDQYYANKLIMSVFAISVKG